MRETTPTVASLKVRIFADGANAAGVRRLARLPYIRGFTTNPTLMRKDGVASYRTFAREILAEIGDRPISFEVIADDFAGMERQAREIASWGPRVYVKIPVTNTRGESSRDLVRRLSRDGIRLNVTALLTLDQVEDVAASLADGPASMISVFAGRIADTGRDPVPVMARAVELMRPHPQEQLLWASPREILNVFQADAIGCHIITVTHDLLNKLGLAGKDLAQFSLETVKMFHEDAAKAGYEL
jgi:transaldolase